jgi:GNAT superfamily N-acetyltransferase
MLFRPWDGYVWVENGKLVGNATLSCISRERGQYAVHNVAVHPGYQGRGIAGRLMQALLMLARDADARMVVLEVQNRNLPAQRLYRRLGFEVYDTVTELRRPAERRGSSRPPPTPLRWRRRTAQDWRALYDLARAAVPPKVQEVTPLRAKEFRLGVDRRIARGIDRVLRRRNCEDWIVDGDGRIAAWAELIGQYWRGQHTLQIWVHPSRRGTLETQLLAHGLDWLGRMPRLGVQAKASEAHAEALRAYHQAGFIDVRKMDRMKLEVRQACGTRGL